MTESSDQPLLQIEGVKKSFGGVKALSNGRLEIYPGEIHTLLGENGAGKSTLVKIIAGVHKPDSGKIFWNGVEIEHLNVKTVEKMGVRIIYQHLNTFPHLNVMANLSIGREPVRFGIINENEEKKRAIKALEQIGVKLDLNQQAETLSVAERQLIEIARALQGDVSLLVMDEPTASLGEREVDQLFQVMRSLRNRGVAIIFISHKLAEVLSISDKVTVLRDGCWIGTVRTAETQQDDLVEMMVGRDLSQGFNVQRSVPGKEVLLEAQGLWTETGLKDVSLVVHKGEVLGIYGLMGSGRTELARALFGADRLLAGEVRLEGRPIQIKSPGHAKKIGLGLVPEDRSKAVFGGISIRENISSASGELIAPRGIIKALKERLLSQEMVTRLGIRTPSIETLISSLSGGNQQKVIVGKWLIRNSRVLILDDPTSGVDVGAKLELYHIITDVTKGGNSIIMSSSELPELLAVSNRILVLHQGRVAGILEGERMTQRNVLHLAVRGLDAQHDIQDAH